MSGLSLVNHRDRTLYLSLGGRSWHSDDGVISLDEHAHGPLIVAFGENRYLRGQNASLLNDDLCSAEATASADGRTIVDQGALVRA